jgi:hypothetical protein
LKAKSLSPGPFITISPLVSVNFSALAETLRESELHPVFGFYTGNGIDLLLNGQEASSFFMYSNALPIPVW